MTDLFEWWKSSTTAVQWRTETKDSSPRYDIVCGRERGGREGHVAWNVRREGEGGRRELHLSEVKYISQTEGVGELD
jgi:hypothetical protein